MDKAQEKIADIIEQAIAPQYRASPEYPRGIATYGEWLKAMIAKDIVDLIGALGYRKIEGKPPLLTREDTVIRRQVHDLIIDYNERRIEIEKHNLTDLPDKIMRGENIQGTIANLISAIAQAQRDSDIEWMRGE